MAKKPPYVGIKTVKDWILFQYAAVIARAILRSKGEDSSKRSVLNKHFGLIVHQYKILDSGKKSMSDYLRDEKIAIKNDNHECIYCGSTEDLTYEHIIPRSIIGKFMSDKGHNLVLCCKSCNSSKGNRELFEWWESKFGREDLPRKHVLSKYLKFLYRLHKANGTLNNPWDDYSLMFAH